MPVYIICGGWFCQAVKKIERTKYIYNEGELMKNLIERAVRKVKRIRYRIIIGAYSFLPLEKNKLIMWSDSFKHYSCNPKYIAEYLLKNFKGKFDIVWVIDEKLDIPKNIPEGIRVVRFFSKEYLKELHTAGYVICNSRTSSAYLWYKRKGQTYIQTWHSSLRLKMIEKDAGPVLGEGYIKAAIADSAKIDYIISGCAFSSNIFKNSFWYDGKIVECGTPRIDYLLTEHNREENMKKAGLSDEFKYIIYAPTFRGDLNYEYNFNFKKLTEACEKRFGGKWKILYRLHPNLLFKITEYNLGDECINVCAYNDMQELITVSEMMITDYSSCMFDMMYINKPCFLYTPDYGEYLKKDRNLYFNIDELPFLRADTEEELINAVLNFKNENYREKTDEFMKKIGSFENGKACEKIAKLLEVNE